MASIFSVQNLQTFLRRKNLRPPGPPGPPVRGAPERGPDDDGAPPSGARWGVVSSAIVFSILIISKCEFLSNSRRGPVQFRLIQRSRPELQLRRKLQPEQPPELRQAAHSASCAWRGWP